VEGRHVALGDPIVMARMFRRMFDMMMAWEISTLYRAISAGNKMVDMRKLQEQNF
jgi:hypothetical protein